MKKKVNLVLLFLMLFVGIGQNVLGQTNTFTSKLGSGQLNNSNLSWKLTKTTKGTGKQQTITYTLSLTGYGTFSYSTDVPWANLSGTDYRIMITHLEIGATTTTGYVNANNNNISVGANAFQGYSALKDVTLNNKGTIGNGAFKNSTHLVRVTIGPGQKSFANASSVSDAPFYGCSNLLQVNIPNNTAAFTAYMSLENLEYLTDSSYGTPEGKKFLREGRNNGVANIPEGVSEIPDCAFRYFTNIKKIIIPSSVENIPNGKFSNYTNLTEVTLNNTGTVENLRLRNVLLLPE